MEKIKIEYAMKKREKEILKKEWEEEITKKRDKIWKAPGNLKPSKDGNYENGLLWKNIPIHWINRLTAHIGLLTIT